MTSRAWIVMPKFGGFLREQHSQSSASIASTRTGRRYFGHHTTWYLSE